MLVEVTLAQGFYDAGFGRFLLSPGFGGVAAFAAALVALLAVWIKSRDDRARAQQDKIASQLTHALGLEQASDAREQVRQERWWASLTWVYDRAVVADDRPRLSAASALDFLEPLYEQAQTDLERHAVEGVLLLFHDETEAAS